jgi:hypothetical protein
MITNAEAGFLEKILIFGKILELAALSPHPFRGHRAFPKSVPKGIFIRGAV